jgi:hypothetical protein
MRQEQASGIDAGEIIETVHGRRAPLIPAATALLR